MNVERRGPGRSHRSRVLLLAVGLLVSACGGAGGSKSGGGGGDWYYHWSCNGDAQCLATNPTGQPSGTVNEGPALAMCTPLLEFAARNWGPAAFNACDQSPEFPVVLRSIVVTPANAVLPLGLAQQYTATARYVDGSSRDVTGQVTWGVVTTGGSGVASIAAGGLLATLAQGTATVSATQGSVTGSTGLVVGPVGVTAIVVAPANPTIAKGQTRSFTATASYSDGSTLDVTTTASWDSQTKSVATMSGPVATAKGAGTSTITAAAGGKTGSTLLTVTGPVLVSIAVRPDAPALAVGVPRRLAAIGTYSDHTAEDVTAASAWASSVTSVATTPAPGVADGVAPGTAVVTASLGDVSGLTTVTVTSALLQAISVSPAQPSVGPGEALGFSAMGQLSDASSYPIAAGVTWASSMPATASIDPSGLASTLAVGTASISAAFDGVVGATTLTVSASPPGTTWTWRPTGIALPTAGEYQLNAIVWTGAQLVAAGAGGHVLTSSDGLTWTHHATSSSMTVSGLAYAPELGLYVAVGAGLWTSTDGATWTQNLALGTVGLSAVAWSGTRFVAVGNPVAGSSVLYASSDGLAWTQVDPGTPQVLKAVIWNGAEFVAVGNAAVVSADGLRWAVSTDTSGSWFGVAWSGKEFLKVASTGGRVARSPDGLVWTVSAPLPVNLYGVTWADNRFVVVGGSGSQAYAFTSTDGITWAQGTLGPAGISTSWLQAVTWTGTRLVAVGNPAWPVNPADGNYCIETSP